MADAGTQTDDSNYNKQKQFAKGFLDVSLMIANAGRLDTILQTSTRDTKFYVVLVLLIISVVLQLILAWMLWFDSMHGHKELGPAPTLQGCLDDRELFEKAKERHARKLKNRWFAEKVDRGAALILLLILVVNIFITAFGAKFA